MIFIMAVLILLRAPISPVKALSRHFRGAMVAQLREAYEAGELPLITNPNEPKSTLDKAMSKEWVVHSKSCIDYTEQVVNYLARYTHRTAISNSRILDQNEDQIRFQYQDYRDQKKKVMILEPDEFIRRFLQHVLPKGVQRIRHCGFFGNRSCIALPPASVQSWPIVVNPKSCPRSERR